MFGLGPQNPVYGDMMVSRCTILRKRMGLRVHTFGLYIIANKVNCGLVEQIRVVYIDLMAVLLKGSIK